MRPPGEAHLAQRAGRKDRRGGILQGGKRTLAGSKADLGPPRGLPRPQGEQELPATPGGPHGDRGLHRRRQTLLQPGGDRLQQRLGANSLRLHRSSHGSRSPARLHHPRGRAEQPRSRRTLPEVGSVPSRTGGFKKKDPPHHRDLLFSGGDSLLLKLEGTRMGFSFRGPPRPRSLPRLFVRLLIEDFRVKAKKALVAPLAEALGFRYSPDRGFSEKEVLASGLFPSPPDIYASEDLVEGEVNGIPFTSSDITLYRGVRPKDGATMRKFFRGTLYRFRLPFSVEGEVRFGPRGRGMGVGSRGTCSDPGQPARLLSRGRPVGRGDPGRSC